VTFMNGDTVLWVRHVADGDNCADVLTKGLIETPTKESTAQYDYTYNGWGASDGGAVDATILQNITADKTVYAIYTATARTYTITYYDSDGTTVLTTQQVAYGSVPDYVPAKEGYIFVEWSPTLAAVTGNASYTASWTDSFVVVPETTITTAEGYYGGYGKKTIADCAETLIEGETYHVTIDGVTYEEVATMYAKQFASSWSTDIWLGNPWVQATSGVGPVSSVRIGSSTGYSTRKSDFTQDFAVRNYSSSSLEVQTTATERTLTIKIVRKA